MAFTYTMLRKWTYFLWPIVRFEYMMMAPYQSYTKYSEEFTVRGLRGGRWEEIDLSPYFPVLLGERSLRENHMYRGRSFDWDPRKEYRRMSELIVMLEARSGKTYDRLVLEWWKWPASPEGFYALKQREFADVALLYRYP